MCDAERGQIYNLGHILLCFEAISGLKVNLRKSELVTSREVSHQDEPDSTFEILKCRISSLPQNYFFQVNNYLGEGR
jgi:hypothetical protein